MVGGAKDGMLMPIVGMLMDGMPMPMVGMVVPKDGMVVAGRDGMPIPKPPKEEPMLRATRFIS